MAKDTKKRWQMIQNMGWQMTEWQMKHNRLLISSTLNIVSIFFWLRIVLVVIHWNSFLFTKPSLFTSNIL